MGKRQATHIQRIEELMRQKGWSIADLARATKLTDSGLSIILSGKRKRPRSDTLYKIAQALETSIDYLTGATDNPFVEKTEPLPAYALDVITMMRHMGEARQEELLRIARTFAAAEREAPLLTPDDLIQVLLEAGDQVKGMEATDLFAHTLQLLEKRRADRLLGDGSGQQPEQDGT